MWDLSPGKTRAGGGQGSILLTLRHTVSVLHALVPAPGHLPAQLLTQDDLAMLHCTQSTPGQPGQPFLSRAKPPGQLHRKLPAQLKVHIPAQAPGKDRGVTASCICE